MADEIAPEGKEEAPAGPKMIMGFPLLQFIFLAANLLVVLGGLGYVVHISLLYKPPVITEQQAVEEIQKKAEKKALPEESTALFIENYPEMTITLRGQQGGKNHYATIEASLVCPNEICLSAVQANRAKILDAFQTILGARSYTELSSLEVKFRVKHEILSQVNAYLKETAATDLLFTNFLVQ